MTDTFTAEAVLSGLRDFQRDTVDHVFERFYGSQPSRHFLVADETGLGKSMVARGIIARTIEHLQRRPHGDEINIVYICSNIDLARQNLERLNVTGNKDITHTSRLTLLATHNRRLASADDGLRVPVNLVSLTPDTSFKAGQRTGRADERHLLFVLLHRELDFAGPEHTAALQILQGSVASLDKFAADVEQFADRFAESIDPTIADEFSATINAGEPSLVDRFFELMRATVRDASTPARRRDEVVELISELRHELAHASVSSLAPDLVIMDEFQRFTDLMEEGNPAGDLARHLFSHHGTRVLLLSATPYKPFTGTADDGEDHHSEFTNTVAFLADGSRTVRAEDVSALLARFRTEIIEHGDASGTVVELRDTLLSLMCRVERPTDDDHTMIRETRTSIGAIRPEELLDFAALRSLAKQLDTQFSVDYWKSVPYFVNFMSPYEMGRKHFQALQSPGTAPTVRRLARRAQRIDTAAVRKFGEIAPGNARMRQFRDETVDRGWERLLWIPPSLPYLPPGGPFADPTLATTTKRLVFSAWSSTPPAVAAMLSYHAEHRLVRGHSTPLANDPQTLRALGSPLDYRTSNPQMTTLALFWPMPHLAEHADPLGCARADSAATSVAELEAALADTLSARLPADRGTTAATQAQHFYWSWPMFLQAQQFDVFAFAEDDRHWLHSVLRSYVGPARDDGDDLADADESSNLDQFLVRAAEAAHLQEGSLPRDLAQVTAQLAMHSPANCAWRALTRLGVRTDVAEGDVWGAAAVIAAGLRSLFNRWESAVLLKQLYPGLPYWRQVLQYCADGNLQAVLDEYLIQLAPTHADEPLDVDALYELAGSAAAAMSLRAGQVLSHDPVAPDDDLRFRTHIAAQYGGKSESDESLRPAQIREAFNSPFWPFVVISTSAGQEGIDFHPWCHHVVHWNTPANPVDFEQRDGRVNRFRGHAVRRNLVARHRERILATEASHPWRTAYAIPEPELGGLVPDWIYPGPTMVVREVMPYNLSADVGRLDQAKTGMALYRLAFGQPRQEDLVELLQSRETDAATAGRSRLDLTPPRRDR